MTGTVLAVRAVGLTHPTVKVRWDGGKISTFCSGSTVSRDALSRSAHPDVSDAALKQWIREQGWRPESFQGLSINEVLNLGVDELQDVVSRPPMREDDTAEGSQSEPPAVKFDQVVKFHDFCRLFLEVCATSDRFKAQHFREALGQVWSCSPYWHTCG